MAEEPEVDRTERRVEARDPIERRVVFSGVRGEGLLRQGMAVDISASGLLIHTAQPDLAGRHLEVELHAGDSVTSGNVVMARAEVMWVTPLPQKGEYAMGLRFLQSVPATDVTGARYQPATREEATKMADSIRRTLDSMEPAASLELSDAARKKSGSPARAPAPTREKRRSWRWLFLLLIFLLMAALVMLLTFGLLWRLESLKPQPAGNGIADPEQPAGAVSPANAQSGDVPGEGARLLQARINQIAEEGPAYYLNRGSYLLAQGRFPAAVQAFQAAQKEAGVTPIERFVAQLGEAESLARDDKTSEALALLETPFADLEYIPETWRSVREQFRDALLAAPGSIQARSPMVNAFTFSRAPESGGAGGDTPDPSGIRIEIDTARYLLNVLENNSIQAVYPVGLGAQNMTPEGRYAIVNKIENPDWYNNGDVVPAGDPENELGSRWLGLADDTGPTQLGIHATDDLDSIGDNQSRGCIRMRPEDVEDLFERVPVGTPVFVRAI